MTAFACYQSSSAIIFFSSAQSTLTVFLLLFCYGLSVLPLCYLYSMMFDNHSTAQISIMAINFASGFLAVIAYFVMSNIPLTQYAANHLVLFFRFFPPYLVGEGLIGVTTNYFTISVLGEQVSVLDWNVAGTLLPTASSPLPSPLSPPPPIHTHTRTALSSYSPLHTITVPLPPFY